jgi:hypothetical protein
MKPLTPSQRGAIAEAAVAAATIELGFTVLRPLCEGRRYDVVIDLEPTLLRVQCKLAHRSGGVLVVGTRTSRYTSAGYVSTCYTPDEIDAIASYTPELRVCHLIPAEDLAGRTMMYLRVHETQNNQATGINWASDYELGDMLRRLRERPSSGGRKACSLREDGRLGTDLGL